MDKRVEFSIKQRVDGKWQHVDLADLAGSTLKEAMEAMAGDDFVAEFILSTGKAYFCGTEELKALFKARGDRAVTFEEGVKQLVAKKRDDILGMTCPDTVLPIVEYFGGEVTHLSSP